MHRTVRVLNPNPKRVASRLRVSSGRGAPPSLRSLLYRSSGGHHKRSWIDDRRPRRALTTTTVCRLEAWTLRTACERGSSPVAMSVQLEERTWEPSWEPFSMDPGGQPRTRVEPGTPLTRRNGLSWTILDAPWRSTDQKVGGSSPSGRATETPARAGVSSCWGSADNR